MLAHENAALPFECAFDSGRLPAPMPRVMMRFHRADIALAQFVKG
jgi:hypothetical protein